MDNDFLQQMKKQALMSALLRNASNTDNDDLFSDDSDIQKDDSLFIASVREAEARVDAMPIGNNLARVADYLVNPDNHVVGLPEEFHNLLSSYLRLRDYYHALMIGEYALSLFPYDIDLLADSIQAAAGSVQYDKGDDLIRRAEKINKQYWNWRLFLMIADYYSTQLSSCSPEEFESLYAKGFAVSEEYLKYLPWDERAYNKQAEYYLIKNERHKARAILEKAIYDDIEGPDRTRQHIIAPQCCLRMIDSILSETIEYGRIVEVAEKGVQYTAQEQPSARMGYFKFRSAMAMDAMITRDHYKNKQTIQEALREYQCAFDLNGDMSYGKTIQERYAALSQNSQNPVTDMPLIKRPLFQDCSQGNND